MTSYGKHGSQRNQLLPTERSFFNYGNVDTIAGYNSFFSGTTGGGVMPENTLVLTNDNSVLHFAANFDSGFNTLHDWTCVFDDTLLPESRNASASSGNGALLADLPTSSLTMQVAADGTVQSTIILESKNYLKMPESGRTYLELQGVFENIAGAITGKSVFGLYEVSGDTFIPQTSWNIDTFHAFSPLNPSGIVLDFQKLQGVVFEYTGKNKGSIRLGFLIGHTIYFAHELAINNSADNTETLNLPIRDELIVESSVGVIRRCGLYNDSNGFCFQSIMNTTASPTLLVEQRLNNVVCYTVGSDHVERKVPFVAGNKDAFVEVTTADTPLFSIRCKDTFSGAANRTTYNLDMLQVNSSSQDENFGCYIKILYNATLDPSNFIDLPDNAGSAIEYNLDATTATGGVELFSTKIMANELSTFSMKDIFNSYRKEFSKNEILSLNVSPKILNQTLTVVASPMTGVISTTSLDVSADIFGGEVG